MSRVSMRQHESTRGWLWHRARRTDDPTDLDGLMKELQPLVKSLFALAIKLCALLLSSNQPALFLHFLFLRKIRLATVV